MHLKLIYRAQAKDEGETKLPIILSLFGLIRYKDSSYIGDLKDKKIGDRILLLYQ